MTDVNGIIICNLENQYLNVIRKVSLSPVSKSQVEGGYFYSFVFTMCRKELFYIVFLCR